MKSEETNLWLKKLLDADHFNTWQAVSYLYRYPSVGTHQYICTKLEYAEDAIVVLPQLVHIFLYHGDSEGYIDSNNTKKSIYCYFLICEMFKEEQKYLLKNTKILQTQLFLKRRINRTLGLAKESRGIHSFDGIFMYFVKSISWVLGGGLLERMSKYERIFLPTKSVTNINLTSEVQGGASFKSGSAKNSIDFLLSLVQISQRLKKLPKNLRQKGLEMELKLINCSLPGRIVLPFSSSKYVLSIRIELSHILNSAENTPFVVVMEVADQTITNNLHASEELRNASLIVQQLNTVSGLAYLSDINNIKENVIASLEKILNTERPTNNNYSLLCTEEQNKKRELICKKLNERGKPLCKITKVLKESPTTPQNSIDYDSIFFPEEEKVYSPCETKRIVDIYYDDWKIKEDNAKANSKFSKMKGWRLCSMIIKTGSSLKQEIIAYQVLNEMKKIWVDEKKEIWLKTYKIYFINDNAGLVETITNAYSIHKIKELGQDGSKNLSLKNYFLEKYGNQTQEYKKATRNFLRSLVGYSLASYILQIKDRHNGNILLDVEGHVVHVDFGFILGDHPGFYCVEVAPFKFCNEYFDLLGDLLEEFKMLFLEGFVALRKHSERLCRIIEILSENSDVKCINKRVLSNFRDRLKLEMSDKEIENYVMWMINKSFNSMGTGLYVSYQYFSNGYL